VKPLEKSVIEESIIEGLKDDNKNVIFINNKENI